MAPEPISTEAQASAAGLATPQNLDLIAQGDDAILRNARFTADALAAAAAADAAAAEAETLAASRADPAEALQYTPSTDPVFSVTDEDGRRTWLEAAADGGPTAHSTAKMSPALAPAVGAALGISETSPDNEAVFSVVDEDRRRTWLEAAADGGPTAHSAAKLRAGLALPAPQSAPVLYVRPAGAGAALLLDDPATGESSAVFTADQITLHEVSGGRAVFSATTGTETRTYALMLPAGTVVPAVPRSTLAAWGDSMTMGLNVTPEQAWPAVTAAALGLPFYQGGVSGETSTQIRARQTGTPGDPYRDTLTTVWAGRNNVVESTVLADVAAMIEHLTPLSLRFLVFGVCNRTTEPTGNGTLNTILRINAQLAQTYGLRYFDVRSFIIHDALEQEGITPTTADLDAIAADTPPPSLMSDSTHLNATGYGAVGRRVAAILQEKGWA